jgi:hypothetical protein
MVGEQGDLRGHPSQQHPSDATDSFGPDLAFPCGKRQPNSDMRRTNVSLLRSPAPPAIPVELSRGVGTRFIANWDKWETWVENGHMKVLATEVDQKRKQIVKHGSPEHHSQRLQVSRGEDNVLWGLGQFPIACAMSFALAGG